LVTYEQKHNDANGEGNRDGADGNLSSNGGVEGETDEAQIVSYRARQARNLLASLLLSRGTPMICGGDEIGRTQRGNNNAYCQDDETTWYDWELDDTRKALLAFTRNLIRVRKSHSLLQSGTFVGRAGPGAPSEVDWFRHDGATMAEADWKNDGTSSLALHVSSSGCEAVDEEGHRLSDDDLLLVLNASDTDIDLVLPAMSERGKGTRWQLVIDTAKDGAREDVSPESATRMTARSLKLYARRALAPAGVTAAYGTPLSTYRLQLTPAFGFREARAITDYLAELGVGGVYMSPILRPSAGSMHGYDVVDHGALNPELGTREDFEAWTEDLAKRGIERLVDFVPNHMGIGSGQNAWWRDVLEHGASSVFADYFDIDWSPPTGALESKILLPLLGGQFGQELEARKIAVARHAGKFAVAYGESSFPTSPRSYRTILEAALEHLAAGVERVEPAQRDELASIVSAIRHLPPASTVAQEEREALARESEVARRRLTALFEASPEIAGAVDAMITSLNENADKLDAFLLEQNYRLASWRVAGDEINYRRFFDLNDLAAIRMEDSRVFEGAHRLMLDLIARGQVTGLRLDHTDGLYDPEAYFSALRAAASRSLTEGGREQKVPLYVVAEKILELGEEIPSAWEIAGTTGYEWLGAANGLWVDPDAKATFDELLSSFAGVTDGYNATAYDAKRAILKGGVSSEVQMLAHRLKRIADRQRRARDFTYTTLVRAVGETLRAFPVHRTYVRPDGTRQPNDKAYIRRALRAARLRNPLVDASVFEFLESILLLRDRSEESVRFAMRFQQLTGPVMAKGIEDTATYRYVRLLSNNDVGCDPSRFGTNVEALHEQNQATLSRWPLSLTTTTTHDTKLSEDVRSRLAALTEIPDEWRAVVARFHQIAARHLTMDVDGEAAPVPRDEYVFFQVSVGAYPFEGLDGEDARAGFTARLGAYMEKATHEAKVRTSWLAPNAAYDAAVARFVREMLGDEDFRRALSELAGKVTPLGASNGLAQLAIRLASPGVPDVYQGCELWNVSLVEPGNRRPVDYEVRKAALAALGPASPELASKLLASYQDGRIKMHVLRTGLRLRRAEPALFLEGAYRPIASASPNLFAFERSLGDAGVAVVAPRLTRRLYSLAGQAEQAPFALGEAAWGKDATIDLGVDATWENVLTGETLKGRPLRVADVLRVFPVAWLQRGPRA
jgi:(1->4)-alpha-D-glucan 1-alpha-D-glucosylmutase